MDKDQPYYFTIKAISENGVSTRTPVVLARMSRYFSQSVAKHLYRSSRQVVRN